MVYLIHFSQPYHHAQHYIGYCGESGLSRRVKQHREGKGSPLIKAAVARGITVKVARKWPGQDRTFERGLKNKKKAWLLCPVCNPKIKTVTGRPIAGL